VAPERIWSRGEAPVRRESGGHQSGANRRKKIFWSCPSTFFTLKVHLVVLVSAFVMVSFLFAVLLLTVPPCPAICKVGVRAPVPYELAPLHTDPPPQKNLELRQKTASDDFVCVNWNRTARLRPSGILRSIAVGSGPLTNWPSTKDRFRWSMTRNERRRSRFAIKTFKRTCALSFRPF